MGKLIILGFCLIIACTLEDKYQDWAPVVLLAGIAIIGLSSLKFKKE